MKNNTRYVLSLILLTIAANTVAQNPLIMNQYTADPSARVFGDRVYVYPSHDILATPGHGRVGWFCMEDYHVFSSANLTDWTDHGMLISQYTVPWADPAAYSMWAPDCIYRNGKYYLYFPTMAKAGSVATGFTVGVAVADQPYGPFTPQPEPIKGIRGIDPNVFIDKNGQAYLYWAQGKIYGAKLKDNMLELASDPQIIGELPEKGLKEGPYLFERKGTYYMTYPHVANKTERLEYAMANNPLGPFKYGGVLMDESVSGCWTNHQSIIEFKNQWYLFYHDDDLSPKFDKARSVRADSLFFNTDGTIRKVIPTRRGVGVTIANKEIQVDRYSEVSKSGVTSDYIDTAYRMKGWQVTLSERNSWVRYNKVDFGKTAYKIAGLNNNANGETIVEIHADHATGPLIATIQSVKNQNWNLSKAKVLKPLYGIHDLFIVSKSTTVIDIDWLRFY